MHYKDRISVNPNIMLGKPCIKGTRITLELIIKKLSEGITIDALLEGYPNLTEDDVCATLGDAVDVISREELPTS
jgi:uncharacterized protein (DUF433 family)